MEYLSVVAPVKERARQLYFSPTLRTITGLAGGNLMATVLGVIGSLVQARFVTPEDLGYFRGFSIATGYAFFLHLGLFGALQRLYPYYIGKGEKERAIAVAEICQAWNVVVSAIVSGVFMLLAVASLLSGNWRAMLGWLVQAVAMAGFIYGGYLGATFRSGHDFATVAKGSVISSIVNTLTLPLFVVAPYIALALRSSLGSLVSLIYMHVRRPLRLRWRFDWKEWLAITKEGMGIFIAGYGGSTGWGVVETSLILTFLGAPALGLWSMSFMLLEAANKVAQAITAVYIPRVTETFGRTDSVAQSMQLCRKPMLWGAPAMLGMAGAISLVLPYVVPILMPHYIAAIPTMSLMMLTLPIIVLELPYTLLVAMGKTIEQNVATYVGLGGFALLALLAIRLGLGLNGLVGASLVGRGVRLAMTWGFLYGATSGKGYARGID